MDTKKLPNAKKIGATLAAIIVTVVALNANAFSWSNFTTSSWYSRSSSWTTPTTSTQVYNDPACENTAKILRATASSNFDYSTEPSKAIDGFTSTAWKSAYKPAWIQIELDGLYNVSGLRVNVNQSPDASSYPKPTPAVHEIYVGDTSAHTLAMTYNKDLYNGKWKRVDFGTTENNVTFIRINTKSTPASQVAWNEIEVCGSSAVSSSWSYEPSYLRAQDGSGYAVVNFCQGRYHILSAYASVPAYVKVLEGSYQGYLPSLSAGQYDSITVDAKNFTEQSPWQGAAPGNGRFVKLGLVDNSTQEVLASVGISRNDSGCYGTISTQDGSTYGIVDKCTGGQHILSIYSQVPATLKVSGGMYAEDVNFNVPYDTYMSYTVDANKFTEPSPWNNEIGNGTAVTFTLYRDDLGTALTSATISRNDSCSDIIFPNYPL